MDDVTCQEVIDLNTALASNIDRSGPLPFWESSGKVLPAENSLLQLEINKLKDISDLREMKLNSQKTCLFIANFTNSHQFKPLLKIPGATHTLEVVQEVKLLGYWFTSDMKAHRHVKFISSIVNKRMWAISKLKHAGVSDSDLKYFYTMKIRSVLESACVVFHSMLTKGDREDIERILKNDTRTIMGDRYISYSHSLVYLDLETLHERRKERCLSFALKCLKDDRFKALFELTPNAEYYFRESSKRFKEPHCDTARYQSSPLVYLTSLLNNHFGSKS